MNGVHDMGGMDGFGKVEPEKDEPVFHAPWEGRVLAMQRAMGYAGAWHIDHSRFAQEKLPPATYLSVSYYHRWALAMESNVTERGAKVVARAWVSPAFKEKLLADSTRACEERGLDVPALKLVVVENTPAVHNMIVCTLCSCYPRMLLGIPPDWYKSRNYRSRAVREPRSVLSEFGLQLSQEIKIRVHDSTADMRYLVLPMRPAGTEDWNEERLASIVSRDCMIGVALPGIS